MLLTKKWTPFCSLSVTIYDLKVLQSQRSFAQASYVQKKSTVQIKIKMFKKLNFTHLFNSKLKLISFNWKIKMVYRNK